MSRVAKRPVELPKGVTAVLHGQDNPTIATASIPAGQVSAEGLEVWQFRHMKWLVRICV